jgi:hypothetical protein
VTKYVPLDRLKPNNWFLNRKKLEMVRQVWRDGEQHLLQAVLVTTIDNELSLLDGHCRAFVAWENGAIDILADIESLHLISGPKDLYIVFHRQAPVVGIRHVLDLGKRIYDLTETTDPDIAVLIAEA